MVSRPSGRAPGYSRPEVHRRGIGVGEKVSHFKTGRVINLVSGTDYTGRVVTHKRMTMAIPDHRSFEEVASIPEVFLAA